MLMPEHTNDRDIPAPSVSGWDWHLDDSPFVRSHATDGAWLRYFDGIFDEVPLVYLAKHRGERRMVRFPLGNDRCLSAAIRCFLAEDLVHRAKVRVHLVGGSLLRVRGSRPFGSRSRSSSSDPFSSGRGSRLFGRRSRMTGRRSLLAGNDPLLAGRGSRLAGRGSLPGGSGSSLSGGGSSFLGALS